MIFELNSSIFISLKNHIKYSNIVELDSNLGNLKVIAYSLLIESAISTESVDYSTFNGRKISDYDFVQLIIGVNSTDFRATMIIPTSIFTSTTDNNYYVSCNSGFTGETFHNVTFKYISDTSVNIKRTLGTLSYAHIVGYKIEL